MKRFHASLLASTALCASVTLLGTLSATAAPLVVSAPAPGTTLTPTNDLAVDLLTVGDQDNESGTLNIGAGVTVTAGNGAIIGNSVDASGTVNVSGSGASFVVDDYLKVGNFGSGTLAFDMGASGTVTGAVYVGDFANPDDVTRSGIGALTVDGAGTNVTFDMLDVRSYLNNTSSVRVTDGAHLTTQLGFYGHGASDIYINGAGTVVKVGARDDDEVTYDNADGWFSPDAGHIELSGGAVLDADGSYIGGADTASMLVTGAGTRWINGLPLFIGGTGNGTTGTGTVTVADGAYVRGATVAVGVDAGSTGTLTVTGTGTILEVVENVSAGSPGNFRVGSGGNGTVTVSDGALIKARNMISIASFAGSTGVLNIGAAEGDAAAAAGYLDGGLEGVVLGEGDATLVFNHTDSNYIFDQTLSGTGTVKLLAGTTRFTADAGALSAQVNLSGGKAYIDADLTGFNTTVIDTGVLLGTGTIGALSVKAGGVVRPGDDGIGTLTATGDVNVQNAATLAIDIWAEGSDQLALTGATRNATIANGALLDLNLKPGADPTETYVIIETNGGEVFKDGNGFTVNDHAALVDSVISYNPDSVDVSFVAANVDWADFGVTENQKAAAAAVQALGLGNAVFNGAMFLSDDDIEQGFDLLSGEIHATTATTLLSGTQWLRGAAFGRLDDLTTPDAGALLSYADQPDTSPFVAIDPAEAASTGWFQGFGAIAETSSDGNAADTETRTGGVIGGIDTEIAGWRIGLVGGYGHDSVEATDRASTASINSVYFGSYAGADLGGWRVKAGSGLGFSQVATERQTFLPDDATLSADYGAWTGQVFGEVGYALGVGNSSIEPFGQLALLALNRDAYAETGGDAALSADAATSAIGLATFGLRSANLLVDTGSRTSLKGELAWQHAMGDLDGSLSQSFAGGADFTVAGAPIATDSVALQVALEQVMGDGATLGLVYDGAFADGLVQHSLSGRVEAKF